MSGRFVGCAHAEALTTPARARAAGCEECLRAGMHWVHLRVCLACGHVGCCDSSPGRHATAHHRESAHALVGSMERGETWGWCYVDEVDFELGYEPGAAREARGG